MLSAEFANILKDITQKHAYKKDKSKQPLNASPSCIKCGHAACQCQLVPTDQYSLHSLPFVTQQSMNDRWPQLTDSNNYQCVGNLTTEGRTLSIKTQGATRTDRSGFMGLDLTHGAWVLVS